MTLTERLEKIKHRDVEGFLSDAIQDCLLQRFGLIVRTDDSATMAKGAMAALKAKEGQSHVNQAR